MLNCKITLFSGHAISRMFARSITRSDVHSAIQSGEIIRSYPDDTPFPSYLILWFKHATPLHIVIAENKGDNCCYIITAYIPSDRLWDASFKTRK